VNVRIRTNRSVSFPKFIGGVYLYSNLTEWYQFSAALAPSTIFYRYLLPANRSATGVALISFNDPSNGIQNVYTQGVYLPVENTAEGAFLYLRLNFVFKNTTQPVWQLPEGTTIDVNVYTVTNPIPEFPGGAILLFALSATSLMVLLRRRNRVLTPTAE
jgi:hypothetical protein